MKTLFTLLICLISFTSIKAQRIICHQAGPQDECFYAYVALKEYIVDTNLVVVFNSLEPLHPAFQGITWQYNKYFYLVSISTGAILPQERVWTIFHEIGHVIDLYEGRLRQVPMMWKDEVIKQDLPWDERPWEMSAEKWAYRLWNRFIDEEPPVNIKLNNIKSRHDCIYFK